MDHGVEYIVKKKDGTIIRVATIQKTHTRLLESQYYAANKEHFEKYQRYAFSRPISIDIELAEDEKTILEQILNVHDDVIMHGWYEVCTDIESTY